MSELNERRAVLLWHATTLAALNGLKRTGEVFLSEADGSRVGDVMDTGDVGSVVNALTLAIEQICSASPYIELTPGLFDDVPIAMRGG